MSKMTELKAVKPATNIVEMRASLLEAFNDLRAGRCDPKDLVELNNTSGKIIQSCAVQLGYAQLRGERPFVSFLTCEEAPAGDALPKKQFAALPEKVVQ